MVQQDATWTSYLDRSTEERGPIQRLNRTSDARLFGWRLNLERARVFRRSKDDSDTTEIPLCSEQLPHGGTETVHTQIN